MSSVQPGTVGAIGCTKRIDGSLWITKSEICDGPLCAVTYGMELRSTGSATANPRRAQKHSLWLIRDLVPSNVVNGHARDLARHPVVLLKAPDRNVSFHDVLHCMY